MTSVYIAQVEYQGGEWIRTIGVYSTPELARNALRNTYKDDADAYSENMLAYELEIDSIGDHPSTTVYRIHNLDYAKAELGSEWKTMYSKALNDTSEMRNLICIHSKKGL